MRDLIIARIERWKDYYTNGKGGFSEYRYGKFYDKKINDVDYHNLTDAKLVEFFEYIIHRSYAMM